MATKPAIPVIGEKVLVAGSERSGFAEVVSYPDSQATIEISYFIGPSQVENLRVPVKALRLEELPAQTRCYHEEEGSIRVGRVLAAVASKEGISYHVAFPNGKVLLLPQTAFHVRSYLAGSDPIGTLAALAHESPFLFERRSEWLRRYARQVALSKGLRGLISSKVELFPHQVEVVRRVLQDPLIRYLLADEVGLGKTVEAGIILRQLRHDSPNIPISVFTPWVIAPQWRRELATRFGLNDVEVSAHADIADSKATDGVVVIDEAHRVVGSTLVESVRALTAPERTPHLLLLSATPVLHHERQLFELLRLLDPHAYTAAGFDQFKVRVDKRRELGRALLALSRSTTPAFIARHAQRCTELLPEDDFIRDAARACGAVDASHDVLMRDVARLRIHLTETYRLHRRLVRTRRAALIAEGDLLRLRREELPLYCNQAALLTELWHTVEEWRVRAAAHVAENGDVDRRVWVALYLEIAEAAAGDPTRLMEIVSSRLRGSLFHGEEATIERLQEIAGRIGDEASRGFIGRFLDGHASSGRWVVFCSDSTRSERLARLMAEHLPGRLFLVTDQTDPVQISERLDAFRSSPSALLVGDRIMEEGLNLQFADGVLFTDVPFDPMRLEQRLGRLDRIDRRGPVKCVCALSLEEPTIALDAAWYEVLTKGFGLLTGSLADLHFLIDRQLLQLGDAAFDGGPAALLATVQDVAALVEGERETAAEQDILDGIDVGGLRETALWKSLEAADEEERGFGNALEHYLKDNVGLDVRTSNIGQRAGTVVQFGLRRRDAPLVPTAMLGGIGAHAGKQSTVTRTLAAAEHSLQFLRPGHPLVEELRLLADWDERGQAFAMWRQAPGVVTPAFVFRIGIRRFVELLPIQDRLQQLRWSDVARGSLLRLVEGWFPARYYVLFVDADGVPVDQGLMDLCKPPYDSARDINLGGARAHVLVDLTGDAAWPATSRLVGQESLLRVRRSRTFESEVRAASQLAYEHFEMVLTRLRMRGRVDNESRGSLDRLIDEQAVLAELVSQALAQPSLRIDWVGAYVLSEQPVCPR